MEFKDMTRSEQYIHLLRIEYQNLVKYAKLQVVVIQHELELYKYEDPTDVLAELESYKKGIEYYTELLGQLKGAENEEILTVSKPETESLKETFKGITCITVG